MLAGRSRVVGLVLGALAAIVASVLLLRAGERAPEPQVHPVVALVEDNLPPWFVAPGAPERIAGRVFHAEGLAFVELTLDIPGTARWRRTALVGTDGRFDFGPRPRGRYKVQAVTPGLESRWVQLDTAHERGDRTEVYVYPPPPPELSDPAGFWFLWGRPIIPKPHWQGQIRDTNGAPLPFVGIQPLLENDHNHGGCLPFPFIVTSDANGRFELEPLPLCGVTVLEPGAQFDVAARYVPPGEPLVIETRRREPAESLASCGALYPPRDPHGSWIRGHVVDERGAPVADATVRVYADLCGAIRFQDAHSRSDGSFALYLAEKDPPAPRTVQVFARDRRGLAYVTVKPGASRSGLRIEVGPGHVVEGHVVDADGRPLVGVVVATDAPGDLAQHPPTDARGQFRTRVLVPGRYHLVVVRDDHLHPTLEPMSPVIDVERPVGITTGVVLRVAASHVHNDRGGLRDCFDLGLRTDREHRVSAVRDEARQADIRVGDRVTLAPDAIDPRLRGRGRDLRLTRDDHAPYCIPYGASVRWQVERAGQAPFVVEVRAKPIAVQ